LLGTAAKAKHSLFLSSPFQAGGCYYSILQKIEPRAILITFLLANTKSIPKDY